MRAARGPGLAALGIAALAAVAAGPRLAAAPSLAALGELAYTGLLEDDEPLRLHDGRWTGRPAEPGVAGGPTALLVPDLVGRGDLDGDGHEDAVVFLQTTTGGSGSFLHVTAVLAGAAGLHPLPARPIGDRAEVEALAIEDGVVRLDAIVPGPADALCCPTLRTRTLLRVAEGELREVASERRGRLHARELAGTVWRLVQLDEGAAVAAGAGLELRFEGERIAGSGGCNRFAAELRSGERDALEIGPITATRRACPAAVMRREQRFFAALQRAHRLAFRFGRLELQHDTPERRPGRLRFARADEPEARPAAGAEG